MKGLWEPVYMGPLRACLGSFRAFEVSERVCRREGKDTRYGIQKICPVWLHRWLAPPGLLPKRMVCLSSICFICHIFCFSRAVSGSPIEWGEILSQSFQGLSKVSMWLSKTCKGLFKAFEVLSGFYEGLSEVYESLSEDSRACFKSPRVCVSPPRACLRPPRVYESWKNSVSYTFAKNIQKEESLANSPWWHSTILLSFNYEQDLPVWYDVHPGGLVQSLRVTLMYTCSLDKESIRCWWGSIWCCQESVCDF